MAETVEILRKARALADRAWVPVDGDGYGVGYGDVVAGEVETCCVVGAVVAVLDPGAMCLAPACEDEDAEAFGLLVDCAGVSGLRSLEAWNDTVGRTKDEVLALFDCAITKADANG